MSSDISIKVHDLSKCYQIYDKPHDRLKQSIFPRMQRWAGRKSSQYYREFWALRDVSLEIKKGETVGIVGRNGSGKSTLLQLICGTLNPTGGGIQTVGRVAALLELGSGFNPEFTGRENVYLNAAVLGLSGQETDARFDRIVEFADIGEFLDQPVKTYSSGMYVRLAFAVIANVDADILIIDEALAVGDAIFGQKCMRYLRAFRERGTLLFVSHDMGSVLNLCQTAVWLDRGTIQKKGEAKDVAEAYLQYTLQETYGGATQLHSVQGTADAPEPSGQASSVSVEKPEEVLPDYGAEFAFKDNLANANGWHTGDADILSIEFQHLNAESETVFQGGERVKVVVRAKAIKPLERPILGFLVRDRLGQDLFGENTLSFTNLFPHPVDAGQEFVGEFVFRLPMLPNGHYAVATSVADGDFANHVQHHFLHNALIFDVVSSKVRFGIVGVDFEKVSLEKLP